MVIINPEGTSPYPCLLLGLQLTFSAAADVLLWRKWEISTGILGVAACAWGVFERSGYTLLTLLANAALALVVITFVYAKSCGFLGR